VNANVGIGPLSITIFTNPETHELVGGTIGLGPGATPVGLSVAYDITGTFTLRDLINFVKREPKTPCRQ
jgi:hypothetical protein